MKDPCTGWDRQTADRLIAQMERAASYDEICRIFSDTEETGQIEKLSPILYRCGSYFIYDILRVSAQQWVPPLKALNEKKFTIFPELVKAVTVSDYCTVFVKIEGMNGKDLLPFETARARVAPSCRRSAYQELERLCDANLYLPRPSRGPWGWQVTADGHRMIAPVHGNVVSIIEDPDEKPEILRAYQDYLFPAQ